MAYYLTAGVLLGLSAGFAPGPLLALVMSETLEHGIGSGIRVAIAPIITDLPIIAVTFLLLSQLSGVEGLLGIISLAGGCYVLYMGFESVRSKAGERTCSQAAPRSLSKGVLTNALSPHPYLFWISVGVPILLKSQDAGRAAPVLFIGGFYLFLVGSKVSLAMLVGRSKSFLSDRGYTFVMKLLGLALVAFSFVLFADGLRLLGFIQG